MRRGFIAVAAIVLTACGGASSAPAHPKSWEMGYTYGQKYHTNYQQVGESPSFWCKNMAQQAHWSSTWASGCIAGITAQ